MRVASCTEVCILWLNLFPEFGLSAAHRRPHIILCGGWSPCHLMHASLNIDSANLFLDLKPENLLFRTPAEDADIMIADFGLSRVMEEDRFHLLTEICGTPGVRRPSYSMSSLANRSWISIWRPRSSRRVRILPA